MVRRKQFPVFENVTIIDTEAEGKATAKVG